MVEFVAYDNEYDAGKARQNPVVTKRLDAAGVKTAMTTRFDFGGTNATLIFSRM